MFLFLLFFLFCFVVVVVLFVFCLILFFVCLCVCVCVWRVCFGIVANDKSGGLTFAHWTTSLLNSIKSISSCIGFLVLPLL